MVSIQGTGLDSAIPGTVGITPSAVEAMSPYCLLASERLALKVFDAFIFSFRFFSEFLHGIDLIHDNSSFDEIDCCKLP